MNHLQQKRNDRAHGLNSDSASRSPTRSFYLYYPRWSYFTLAPAVANSLKTFFTGGDKLFTERGE